MTNKPNNVTSLIKKRDLKKAKEILYKEFELIGLSDSFTILDFYLILK